MTGRIADHRSLTFAMAATLVVGACAAGTAPSSTPGAPRSAPASSVGPGSPGPVISRSPEASAGGASPTASAAPSTLLTQAWATATLTDVETGEPFRIADLAGRTVFVEAMAIWCTKCRAQQREFTAALERIDPAEVAYVVLTIEPSESVESLARYEADQGFAGRYAVAGRDVSAALEADFGPTVLSPPTVPVIVIRPDGSVEFKSGQHSADDIVALVEG